MDLADVRKLWLLFASLTLLNFGFAGADGRVFLLDLRNSSDITFEVASGACDAHGAQLASAIDLHNAVMDCTFSACARGWLAGPSIGTTVCRTIAGSLRAVDMQVENVTQTYENLAVFCVKDTGAPCGGPPSFPNAHLQGQTGLELGDELLYACNPGYILANGERAFSLLCDSCGEWYGLVQLCVKDKTEVLIDYEDKLPVNHHLYDGMEEMHHVSLMPGTTGHGEEEESTPEPEQLEPMAEEEKDIKIEDASEKSLTETLVSQLSQKHMFWFPSEAFHGESHPLIPTDTPISSPTKEEAYITAKTDDSQSETQITSEHHNEYTTQTPAVSHSVVSTVEAWLDGYPVRQEEEKADTGSKEEVVTEQGIGIWSVSNSSNVEGFGSVTDSPKDTGVGEAVHIPLKVPIKTVPETHEGQDFGRVTDHQEEEVKDVTENIGMKGYQGGFHSQEEMYQGVTDTPPRKVFNRVSSPSKEKHFVTKGTTNKETEGEAKRPLEGERETVDRTSKDLQFHDKTDRPNDVELSPTPVIGLTQVTSRVGDKILEKRPMLYTPDSVYGNVSTSLESGFSTPSGMAPHDTTLASTVHVTSNKSTPIISIPWETKDHVEKTPSVHHDVSVTTHDNRSATERDTDHSLDQQKKPDDESCSVDPCQMTSYGPTIAAIIIAIVAAIVGLALGVWCYRRRQQKTSHYQLNGTNRQTQCIELQQTV